MATENPYTAPASHVADSVLKVPEEVLKKIKNAWVAALISATLTLILTLVAMSGAKLPLNLSAWELIDVGLILGLAFGIYKKSRTCAVLMLVYFVASKIIIMAETGKPSGIVMAIIFIYFFWQGVSGTFAYHRIKNSRQVLAAGGG